MIFCGKFDCGVWMIVSNDKQRFITRPLRDSTYVTSPRPLPRPFYTYTVYIRIVLAPADTGCRAEL
jgi:hypothetical protein